jgi:hypothetical protein
MGKRKKHDDPINMSAEQLAKDVKLVDDAYKNSEPGLKPTVVVPLVEPKPKEKKHRKK